MLAKISVHYEENISDLVFWSIGPCTLKSLLESGHCVCLRRLQFHCYKNSIFGQSVGISSYIVIGNFLRVLILGQDSVQWLVTRQFFYDFVAVFYGLIIIYTQGLFANCRRIS